MTGAPCWQMPNAGHGPDHNQERAPGRPRRGWPFRPLKTVSRCRSTCCRSWNDWRRREPTIRRIRWEELSVRGRAALTRRAGRAGAEIAGAPEAHLVAVGGTRPARLLAKCWHCGKMSMVQIERAPGRPRQAAVRPLRQSMQEYLLSEPERWRRAHDRRAEFNAWRHREPHRAAILEARDADRTWLLVDASALATILRTKTGGRAQRAGERLARRTSCLPKPATRCAAGATRLLRPGRPCAPAGGDKRLLSVQALRTT